MQCVFKRMDRKNSLVKIKGVQVFPGVRPANWRPLLTPLLEPTVVVGDFLYHTKRNKIQSKKIDILGVLANKPSLIKQKNWGNTPEFNYEVSPTLIFKSGSKDMDEKAWTGYNTMNPSQKKSQLWMITVAMTFSQNLRPDGWALVTDVFSIGHEHTLGKIAEG